MPQEPDVLASLSPEQYAKVFERMLTGVLGKDTGGAIAKRFAPMMATTARQLGDAEKPEDNFWKGAWRIYEID